MAEVTDGDRERAEDIACDLWNDMGNANVVDIIGEQAPVHAVIDGWAKAIAAALAEEREKARAPFLSLMRKIPPDSPELRWVADQIQRAAEENE